MQKFDELVKIAKLNRKNSQWSSEVTMQNSLQELQSEVTESIEAEADGNLAHLQAELGDVFWDILGSIAIAEEKGHFTLDDVLQGIITKIKRRKDWIFAENELSKDEEMERWALAKAKERERNQF